jgi:hypothetical protein
MTQQAAAVALLADMQRDAVNDTDVGIDGDDVVDTPTIPPSEGNDDSDAADKAANNSTTPIVHQRTPAISAAKAVARGWEDSNEPCSIVSTVRSTSVEGQRWIDVAPAFAQATADPQTQVQRVATCLATFLAVPFVPSALLTKPTAEALDPLDASYSKEPVNETIG